MLRNMKTDSADSGLKFHLPFLIGDGMLLLVAWGLFAQANRPMLAYELVGIAFCVALGAWLGVWPFVLRHRAEMRRLATTELTDAVTKIQQLEEVARQVSGATGRWQTVHAAAEKIASTAESLTDRMVSEQADFRAFLEKAHDAERGHLRLEVEKLRREEGLWVQVLVFLLDHTHALFNAASRSGQQNVINQIGRFRDSCLDATKRVGLAVVMVEPGSAFDPEAHVIQDETMTPNPESTVTGTLAPGYNFRGKILRKPMVALEASGSGSAPKTPPAQTTGTASRIEPTTRIEGDLNAENAGAESASPDINWSSDSSEPV